MGCCCGFSTVAMAAEGVGENAPNSQLPDSVVYELRELSREERDSVFNAQFRAVMEREEWNRDVRQLDELLAEIPLPDDPLPYNLLVGPWVFSGYRAYPEVNFSQSKMVSEPVDFFAPAYVMPLPPLFSETPAWLHDALIRDRVANSIMYHTMIEHPSTIDYAYWDLPVPPSLPEEDVSFTNYIKRMNIPDLMVADELMPTFQTSRIHWLHNANAGVQFSQAYLSSNWYQGGNNYLALLLNLLWDVQLNPVYHPNKLLQSTLSYKLGLNSTPRDSYHKYSISEDLFQWNFKAGLKAFKNFFYSYTLAFKTQLLRNYESNSDVRKASFLSPGDLNMGIGMSYSYTSPQKSVKLGVSLSPLSYNLKTCIDNLVDPTPFNIRPGHHVHNEIGTNAEANLEWAITPEIGCRSRFFAFTDYNYFQSDIETTLNFAINRFLSTQVYFHLRYDSSSDASLSNWKHWMLKEILSFGLSYTFSTKPE